MNKKLKIYYTSDTHGYIYPTNYQSRDEFPMGVLSAISEFEKDKNTLIIDGGDTIQGSPFVNFMWKELGECEISKAFNQGGYDYYTLGNHDFNNGYDALNKYISSMNAKCVIANLKDKTNRLNIVPYEIKKMENGLKVGITGIVTDYITVWENPDNIKDLEFKDAFESAKLALLEMKDKCDISICIYHGGYEADLKTGGKYSSGKENIGYKILENLDFDLLLTAHQHSPTNLTDVHNTKTIQTSANVNQYAFIEIEVTADNKKTITGEIKKVTANAEKTVYNQLKGLQDKVQDYLDIKIGALSEEILPLEKEVLALNGSRMADLVNQIVLEYSKADFACVGLSNTIIGFKKEVTIRDVLVAFPYSNTIVVLEVTREIIKKALERCAEYFDIKDNKIVISDRFLIPKVEHYNYDFFAGFSYEFDITKPLGERVVSMKINGEEMPEDKKYSLATSSYRATGTGGYPFYKDCKILREYGDDSQEIILNYIQTKDVIDIKVKSNYKVIK